MKKLISLTFCLGIIAVFLCGCGNQDAKSIVRVLNERQAALLRSEQVQGNPKTLSLAEYSAALKTIDISGCPQKFSLAWREYIQVIDSKKGFGVLVGSPKDITDAEGHLEEAAIDEGVKFDYQRSQ
jgi:hypothetical protein